MANNEEFPGVKDAFEAWLLTLDKATFHAFYCELLKKHQVYKKFAKPTTFEERLQLMKERFADSFITSWPFVHV